MRGAPQSLPRRSEGTGASSSRGGKRSNGEVNHLLTEESTLLGREMRSLEAMLTSSARDSAFIFFITLPLCAFTVISLMSSSFPTCLFNMPETTNADRKSVVKWQRGDL